MLKKKKAIHLAILLVLVAVFVFVSYYYLPGFLPGQDDVQAVIQSYGNFGLVVYFLLAYVTVVVTPLNFSWVGLAGGFVYGPLIAFLINWIAKIVGNLTAFFIGRKYGRKAMSYFLSKADIKKYDKLVNHESVSIVYFASAFIPLGPGDTLSYFLGCSSMKLKTFVSLSVVGTMGTAFAWAYVGSGQAFDDPIFLIVLAVLFLIGLFWVHKNRKKYDFY